jgi:hypothetical protein
MSTTRFKCPGCDLTFAGTGGIIKHLKNVSAEHPLVAPPITQEATRVICSKKDDFWVVEAPPTTAPTMAASNSSIAQSLEEVRSSGTISTQHITHNSFAQLMGFTDFEGGRNAGISDDADAKFLVKAKSLLEMQIKTAFKDKYLSVVVCFYYGDSTLQVIAAVTATAQKRIESMEKCSVCLFHVSKRRDTKRNASRGVISAAT